MVKYKQQEPHQNKRKTKQNENELPLNIEWALKESNINIYINISFLIVAPE